MLPGLSCMGSWTFLHECGVSPSDHLWIMLENLLCVSKVALIQVLLHSATSVWWYYSSQKIQWRCESVLQVTGLHSPPCRWAPGLQNLQLNSAFGQNNCYSMEMRLFSFFVSLFQRQKEDGEKSNLIIHFHSQSERSPPHTSILNETKAYHFHHIFTENVFNSLTIYFNHVVANVATENRWSGKTGLKTLFKQKSKAVQECLENDRFHCIQHTIPTPPGPWKSPMLPSPVM